MRKEVLLILILTLLFLFIFAVAATKEGPVRDRLSKAPLLSKGIRKLDKLMRPYLDAVDDIRSELKAAPQKKRKRPGKKAAPAEEKEGEIVTLLFKDGSKMQALLFKETQDMYMVSWKGADFDIRKDRVAEVLRGKEALEAKAVLTDKEIIDCWPYKNDIVVRLTNRMVMDARIKSVHGDMVTLLYSAKGGGYIEQDIRRSRIEYLIFKPVRNEKSGKIESNLKRLFPQMGFYESGGFTIITDSYADWVNKYEKTLKEVYTDIYLKFLELFRDAEPSVQNFVVIFDDILDYFEYAATDGVPGWAAAGYFLPTAEVLYLYNVLGDKFSDMLFEAFVGETGRTIDDIVETIEDRIDKRYHIFLEGRAMSIKGKFWEAYDYYKGIYRDMTLSTLRHEFTHEVFHNWGLQMIVVSKITKDGAKLIDKKKKMLQSSDPKEKARILRDLATWQSGPMDFQAANSWLTEGVATYCETYPLGSINKEMLFLYQEMDRKGDIYPLEALTYSKIGSFPGIAPRAMLYSYAQSWGFVKFLMERYPVEFINYQKRMKQEKAEGVVEDVQWLLDALGKSLQDLRGEFKEYMDGFEKVDDPFTAGFARMYEIFSD